MKIPNDSCEMTFSELRWRVAELRAWAANRIAWCATEEERLTIRGDHGASIEPWAERRALEAVLRFLDGET